jgi:hypothetical protein
LRKPIGVLAINPNIFLSLRLILTSLPLEIEYVTAHFGKVPYGSGIVGFLHTVDTENQDGCKEMSAIEPFDHYDDQPMILLRRGGCEFGTKAINAQNAGAKMLLIADDKDQELLYYPVAVDQRKFLAVKFQ